MTGKIVVCKIEAARSRFTVKAFAGGILSAFGHNPTFAIRDISGEVTFTPDEPAMSSVRMEARPDSLELTDDIKESDRKDILRIMQDDVLEVRRYRQILFQSSKVTGEQVYKGQFRVMIEGDLLLHGVSKKITIESGVTSNSEYVRAYGNFSINQKDFGIRPYSKGGGSLEVKNEVKLNFDIQARL